MNPIYKFTLSADGGAERAARPVYRDDLAKEYEKQTGQEFFRAKLSGKLTFVRDDYDFIVAQPFDTEFVVRIYISYDAGQTWTEYWKGSFWKTGCTFNADDRNLTVTPDVLDRYTAVLNGLEKEFDLISLEPVTNSVSMDKRPMIQVYVPGQTVIGCFLSGMWWEQECSPVEWTEKDEEYRLLLDVKYGFDFNKAYVRIRMSGNMSPQLPESAFYASSTSNEPRYFRFYTEDGKYLFYRYAVDTYDYIEIQDTENRATWRGVFENYNLVDKYEVTLSPVGGTTATGNVIVNVEHRAVFARYVTDMEVIPGDTNTMPIPPDDLVPQNRNYHYVVGYSSPNSIWITERLISTPTKWGIYQPGQYYDPGIPASAGLGEVYPVSREAWNIVSIWFTANAFDTVLERRLRTPVLFKHAYPVSSVIQVLLDKIAPGITHDGTTDYSLFLYGTNPLTSITQRLLISPKSNFVSLGYDQPAQRAPVTLKTVLDMLRDCFRCYWFIDDDGRFRIEHVLYFMRGGRYRGTPAVGRDLTAEAVRPGGKKWAFATSSYQYDKPEMTARYEFGWMDDVTQLFDGNPLEILSNYVNKEKIDKIEVQNFTSDVDYIMLNPSNVSMDGFVLMAASLGNGEQTFTVRMPSTLGPVRFGEGELVFYEGVRYRITANVPNGQPIVFFFEETGLDFAILTPPDWSAVMTSPVTAQGGWINCSPSIYGQLITVTVEQLSEDLRLPYVDSVFDETHHVLQNAWASFWFLQRYYMYDLPAWQAEVNGVQVTAQGVKKLKTQTLSFPAPTDPDLKLLVKTAIGNGQIGKMSINLSSRNAKTTLRYEPEQ